MYLKNIIVENNGPIDRLEILEKDLFKENGDPKILVLTGKNGSGKTVLLSNITDAFFELASQNFSDILPMQGLGHSYYRVVGGSNQKTGTKHSFSFLNFEGKYKELKEVTLENGEVQKQEEKILKEYQYLEKTGELTIVETQEKTTNLFKNEGNWEEGKIITNVESDKNIKDDFLKNTYCFFPVSRFETPHWLNEWKSENREQIKISNKYNGKLDKPIIIENSLSDNKSWILDIFLDYLTDYIETQPGSFNAPDIHIKNFYKQSKSNIENILSKIIQRNIEIQINTRLYGGNRLKLVNKDTGINFIPSLDNLSGGQSILLNMFASIIRFSDQGDISKSINLSQIEGVVLIDEIDLSLHIDLQKEVLPELLSLFPKIQFIITSHSPFFLLGMEEKSKQDQNFQYQIIKMPDSIIDNDIKGLEEVKKAYGIFEENFEDFKTEFDELNKKLASQSKTLIITEGKTDWKHIENALKKFKEKGLYLDLDIDFLKFEDDMGDNVLWNYCIAESKKNERLNNIICIFDRDNKDDFIRKASDDELGYKKLGNKFYSLCIPKNTTRKFNNICIEHYYTDDELKILDKNNRRLFLGIEFYKTGNSIDGKYQTDKKDKCTKNSIIDDNVFYFKDGNHNINIAVSKNDFAENIINGVDGFNNFDLSNFEEIFKIIDIIEKLPS